MRTRAFFLYILPVVVFVALRLAILDTSIDRLGHLGEGELAHAELAFDLNAGGLSRPIWDYQVVPFHGGTFLSSLLYVPWSRAFGLSFASLKGLALGYATLAMVLWMWALRRLGGARAAGLFAWMYVCGPPVLTRMQLTLWGTHAELNALLALAVVALVWWEGEGEAPLEGHGRRSERPGTPQENTSPAGEGRERRGRGRAGLDAGRVGVLGLTLGLAVAFNYAAIVFAGVAAVAVLAARRDGPGSVEARPRRWQGRLERALSLAIGFGAGVAPLGLLILRGRGQLGVYGQGPSSLLEGALERLPHLPRLALQVPPFSPQIPAPVRDSVDAYGAVFHGALYGAALLLLAQCLRHAFFKRVVSLQRGRLEARASVATIAAYPLVFLVAFTAVHLPFTSSTSVTFGFCPRYAATLYPFLYAVAALWITRRQIDVDAENAGEGSPDPGGVIQRGSLALTGEGSPASIGRGALALTGKRYLVTLLRVCLLVTVLIMSFVGLRDDLKLIDRSSPGMAARFDAIRLTRAGFWGVDRRSLPGVERFLKLEATGHVSRDEAAGVRQIMGTSWNDRTYWQLLDNRAHTGGVGPGDGPTEAEVNTRVREALAIPGISDEFREGVEWGRRLALSLEQEE